MLLCELLLPLGREAAGGTRQRLLRASGGLCGWSGGQDEPLRAGSRLERVTRCQRGDGTPTHRKPLTLSPRAYLYPHSHPQGRFLRLYVLAVSWVLRRSRQLKNKAKPSP